MKLLFWGCVCFKIHFTNKLANNRCDNFILTTGRSRVFVLFDIPAIQIGFVRKFSTTKCIGLLLIYGWEIYSRMFAGGLQYTTCSAKFSCSGWNFETIFFFKYRLPFELWAPISVAIDRVDLFMQRGRNTSLSNRITMNWRHV